MLKWPILVIPLGNLLRVQPCSPTPALGSAQSKGLSPKRGVPPGLSLPCKLQAGLCRHRAALPARDRRVSPGAGGSRAVLDTHGGCRTRWMLGGLCWAWGQGEADLRVFLVSFGAPCWVLPGLRIPAESARAATGLLSPTLQTGQGGVRSSRLAALPSSTPNWDRLGGVGQV